MDTLHLIDLALRFGCIATIVIHLFAMLRDFPWRVSAFVVEVTFFALIAYLLAGSSFAPLFPTPIRHGISYIGSLNPVLIWLACCYMFIEQFRLRWPYAVIATLYVVIACLAEFEPWGSTLIDSGIVAISVGLLQACFAAHALYLIAMGANDDLVEERRRARFLIMSVVATYILVVAGGNFIFAGGNYVFAGSPVPDFLTSLELLLLLVASFALLVHFLVSRADELFPPVQSEYADRPTAPNEIAVSLDRADQALLSRLNELMEHEKLFLRPDLTVGSLAEEVGIPEHKLRSLINYALQYRNFATYLSHFRIADARERLTSTSASQLSILDAANLRRPQAIASVRKKIISPARRTLFPKRSMASACMRANTSPNSGITIEADMGIGRNFAGISRKSRSVWAVLGVGTGKFGTGDAASTGYASAIQVNIIDTPGLKPRYVHLGIYIWPVCCRSSDCPTVSYGCTASHQRTMT